MVLKVVLHTSKADARTHKDTINSPDPEHTAVFDAQGAIHSTCCFSLVKSSRCRHSVTWACSNTQCCVIRGREVNLGPKEHRYGGFSSRHSFTVWNHIQTNQLHENIRSIMAPQALSFISAQVGLA